MVRFCVSALTLLASVLMAVSTALADGPRSVELGLPAGEIRADAAAEMREAIAWLVEHGATVDRCGVDVEGRRVVAEFGDDALLDDAVAAGYLVLGELAGDGAGPRGPGLDAAYLDPTEVEAFLSQVVADHPDITRMFSVGVTTEGRDIWAIEISDHPGDEEDEPAVLLNGLHHSREVVTPHIITDAIDVLTDGYAANDPQIVAWVRDYKSIMIPMVNPDGSARVHAGDLNHRKNLRAVCTTSNPGVDLNRNYPYKWGAGTVCERGSGSSGSTCSDAYRGASAASEPETQAMMALSQIMRFSIVVSYHSYGRFIDYPYACNPGSPDLRMPEHDAIDAMMHGMRDAIFDVDGVSYAVNSPIAIGPVNGDDTSWYYAHEGAYPFIVETTTSFQPSFSLVAGIVARNRAGWRYLYERLGGARIDVHVTSDCEPLDAEVTILDYTYDTGELPRMTFLPFGRWTYLVPPNDNYTIRVSKPGYQTQDMNVVVGGTPVNVEVSLVADTPGGILAGDMNDDCVVNGADIAPFSQALIEGEAASGAQRARGDFDDDCVVTQADVNDFVTSLLAGVTCP
ncbi:MAG TPA: M14 family zinc carboxypeptidase [Phycisphaerae bacterium]|nr:M14 family zinc carboxypeptidase [Phycisphaerae bacterium]HRW52033.1 M14 family zinc carboxypeptidase [Phycisphaerae bacterium]